MIDHTVSVIIPAYMSARTIGRALDSVLAQTRLPEEVLVVDDGSTDALLAALAPYRGRVILIRKPNGGAASARNLGIERSSGSVIAFLDADDYWEPGKLELQLDVLRRHPEVGLIAGRYYKQLPGDGERRPWSAKADGTGFGDVPVDRVLHARGIEIHRIGLRAWTSTVAVRRDALGGHRFDGKVEPAEDRDLWIRLAAEHPSFLASEPLATAVLEPNSMSRSNIDKDFGNMITVLRRNAGLAGRRELRNLEARFYRLWAACHLGEGRPREALPPALRRWARDPASPSGWWIVLKCLGWAATKAAGGIRPGPLVAGERAPIELEATSTRGALP
jgi:glycosyltransferase involved in cell wall biosynthesis